MVAFSLHSIRAHRPEILGAGDEQERQEHKDRDSTLLFETWCTPQGPMDRFSSYLRFFTFIQSHYAVSHVRFFGGCMFFCNQFFFFSYLEIKNPPFLDVGKRKKCANQLCVNDVANFELIYSDVCFLFFHKCFKKKKTYTQ